MQRIYNHYITHYNDGKVYTRWRTKYGGELYCFIWSIQIWIFETSFLLQNAQALQVTNIFSILLQIFVMKTRVRIE